MQPLVADAAVVDVALVVDVERFDQEGQGATLGLFDVTFAELFAHLEKLYGGGVLAHHEAAEVTAHAVDEMLRLETFINNIVDHQQDVAGVALQEVVHDSEIVVVVKHIEVFDHRLVGDVVARKADHLVEDRERIAQGTVGFLGDDVQSLRLSADAFAFGDKGQVLLDVFDGNTLEIKDLTA